MMKKATFSDYFKNFDIFPKAADDIKDKSSFGATGFIFYDIKF